MSPAVLRLRTLVKKEEEDESCQKVPRGAAASITVQNCAHGR